MIRIIGIKENIRDHLIEYHDKHISWVNGNNLILDNSVDLNANDHMITLDFEGEIENILKCDFYRVEIE